MIRWKGHVPPQMNETDLASSIDLVPTLLAAVGLEKEITPEMEGINLLDQKSVSGRKQIFGEIFEHDIQHMTDPVASLRFRWVIDGEWKLILPHPGREPDAKVELFHITADPWEEQDLAQQKPELVKKLSKEIQDWWPVTE